MGKRRDTWRAHHTRPCRKETDKADQLAADAGIIAGHQQGSGEGHFVCMEESELWRFPEKLLKDPAVIRQYPAQIVNLLRSMGITMLIHHTFLAATGTGNHEVHLCRFIPALARKHNSRPFSCHMPQQEVADLLGIHSATLARVPQHLKQANVISSFTSHRIRIEDWDKLNALASR